MGGWQTLLVVLVVVLAAVATAADTRGRRRPKRASGGLLRRWGGRRGWASEAAGDIRPVAGEVWWGRVPLGDGGLAADGPCVVLSVDGGTARVARVGSGVPVEGPGVVALPSAGSVDSLGGVSGIGAVSGIGGGVGSDGGVGGIDGIDGPVSWLEAGEPHLVPLDDLRRRMGGLDAETWAWVLRAAS